MSLQIVKKNEKNHCFLYFRAIALAATATSGRLGAIFGNMVFGMLIDINCAVPIHLFGFLLICKTLLLLSSSCL